MSKIHIKYMTDEALATVKANTDAITGKLIENPKSSSWLKDFFPGTLWVNKNRLGGKSRFSGVSRLSCYYRVNSSVFSGL